MSEPRIQGLARRALSGSGVGRLHGDRSQSCLCQHTASMCGHGMEGYGAMERSVRLRCRCRILRGLRRRARRGSRHFRGRMRACCRSGRRCRASCSSGIGRSPNNANTKSPISGPGSSSGAADTHRATNTPCCSVLSRGRVPPVSEFRSGARYAHVSETFGIVLRTTTQPGLRSNCGAVSEIYFDQASITRGLVPRCYKARYSTAGVLGALLIKVSHSNTPERRVAW